MQKNSRDKSNRYSPYGAAPAQYMPPAPQMAPMGYQQAPQMDFQQQQAAAAYYGMMMQQQQLGAAPAAESAVEELKVSKTTTPKAIAGKIAADARVGKLTPVVARGKAPINTATKAIAIACSFLQDNAMALSVSPYHKNDGDNASGRSVVFYLKKKFITDAVTPTTTLKVTKSSVPSKVAGSIASKIRQGEVIAMQGIGPDAVVNAIDAFVAARRFLKVDSAMDIEFTPSFVTVPLGDKTASAMHFTIEAVARA